MNLISCHQQVKGWLAQYLPANLTHWQTYGAARGTIGSLSFTLPFFTSYNPHQTHIFVCLCLKIKIQIYPHICLLDFHTLTLIFSSEIQWQVALAFTDRINFRVLAEYLAEGFPGIPVSSAQAHYHIHSKTPHHVVLQIPESRRRMFNETGKKLILLHPVHFMPLLYKEIQTLYCTQTQLLIQTDLLVYLANIRLSLL